LANTPQARKRVRQAAKHRTLRVGQRAAGRTVIKKATAAIEHGDREAAVTACRKASSLLDNIADKGVIHKNKAARHKRRLHARLRGMEEKTKN